MMKIRYEVKTFSAGDIERGLLEPYLNEGIDRKVYEFKKEIVEIKALDDNLIVISRIHEKDETPQMASVSYTQPPYENPGL